MNLPTRSALTVLLLTAFSLAMAEEAGVAAFERIMAKLFPGQRPDAVAETPVKGIYEVVMGPRVFYLSADGRYLIRGDIIDLAEKRSITEPRQGQARIDAINEIGEQNMIIFSPQQFDHTVTVFTDIDCGYCRKLHREIDEYQRKGMRIRYLMYPRSGVDSDSYRKAVAVWCSGDRADSLTRAKRGEKVEGGGCEHPVKRHMLLGELLGIRGTPALVSDRGELLPGYVPAERLREHLDAASGGG